MGKLTGSSRPLRADVELAERTWGELTAILMQRPWGGRCEMCGKNQATDPHHRVLRSQWGQDVPSNIAALCRFCHDWCHEHPVMARRRGYIIWSHEDWRVIPITFFDGSRWLLTDDYGYKYFGPPTQEPV